MDNTARDQEICRRYTVDHVKPTVLAKQFRLTRQRVWQILSARHIVCVPRSEALRARTEFLGAEIAPITKDALRVEADKQGKSMSELTADILDEELAERGYPVIEQESK